MMKRNVLLLGFFLCVSLIINSLSAAAQDDFFNDWMRFIFVDLSDLAQGGDQIFVIYFKIFLFFLVFAVLFWSAEKIFKEQKPIAITVAFVISLMSVILLPQGFVLMIFSTYSAIIGYVFILLPVIIGAVLATKLAGEMKGHEHVRRIIKGIIFIVIAIITFSLSSTLMSEGDNIYFEVAKWAKLGAAISLFAGIYYILTFAKEETKKPSPK